METNTSTPEVKPEAKPEIQNEKKSGKRRFLIFLLLLSFAGNGVLGWLFLKERNRANVVITEKETIIVERENVKTDLMQLQSDYASLRTSDKEIQDELDQKKEQIAKMIVEADKHKNDAYFISKLKKETETLRKIMQDYVHTIDSLGTMNKTLLTENVHVRTQFLSEKEKAAELAKEKADLQGVVNTASILRANGTKAMGIIVRSGGKKESETKRARKADKIKVTLTISENTIAKKGNRDVYLRILTPDGKELARALDDANSFSFRGARGFFCARQTINYDNKELPISL
ncbi:MAG: hypothetical protein ACHQHP_06795, partial [Bacteroidia bacterium]